MSALYFGGSGVDLGTVHALPHTSFSQFVKEHLGHPALVNFTRAQFHAFSKKERDQHKRVPYFTPAVFKTDPANRKYEYALHCNLVAIDIDDAGQAGAFFARPASIAERLEPFAFAAYTTASSTPEAPRLRIVVSALHIPLDRYVDAVRHVAVNLLGLPDANKESKVSVQPMYLPTLYRDDDPVDSHPLIIAVPEGASLTAGVLSGVSASSGLFSESEKKDLVPDASALDYLRPRAEGVTLADCESALTFLDPDCDYMEWIAVAAAMKHQYPRDPESAEAFKIFDAWSAKGQKYVDTHDTWAKWDSFKFAPKKRAPITIRTLFKRAADAGWNQVEEVAGRCYAECECWIVFDGRKGEELLESGVSRIAAAPLLSQLQRSALISMLQTRLTAFGMHVTRTELKAALNRLERAAAKANMEPSLTATPDNQFPPWARGICYVATQNEFFQRHTARAFKPEVLDAFFGVQLMTPSDSEHGSPMITPRNFLLNILKCPRVDNYRYDPARGAEAIVTDGKKRFVNIYIPTYPEASNAEAEAAGALFHGHIKNLVAEERYQRILISFLAYMVQFPGQKIRWSVLLQGARGCGKTLLAEAMRAVLGREHVRGLDAWILFSDFNGWATGSQLIAIEEIRVVGHNRYEVMNRLKTCISNDHVTINEKQQKAYETPNVSNYLLFTNHHDALAVNDGDRGYFVLKSPLQNKSSVLALGGKDYFTPIFDMIRTKPAALRAWFEQWEIDPEFDPNSHAPHTRYMDELQQASSSPLAAAVWEALEDGDHPLVKKDFVSTRCLKAILDLQRLPAFTDQSLAAVLRDLDYLNLGRVKIENDRHYMWAKRGTEAVRGDAQRRALGRLERKPEVPAEADLIG